MISEKRRKELEKFFWEESNEEESQEWRDSLTCEEEILVSEWDGTVNNGIAKLCEQIKSAKRIKT